MLLQIISFQKKEQNQLKQWFKDNVLGSDSLGEDRFGEVNGNGVDVAGDCVGTTGQES